MVLAENSKSLLISLLRDQPTRRLRNEPDESQLDDGGESLSKSGDAPAPVALDALGAKRQPGTNDSTNVPQTVVDGGDTSTVLRVAELGKQQRRRKLGKRVAETHQETSTHEVVKVLCSGLDRSTNNHDNTTDSDSRLATEVVGNERSDRERGN